MFFLFLFVRPAARPAFLEGGGEPLMIYIYNAKLRQNACYLRDLCWQFKSLVMVFWLASRQWGAGQPLDAPAVATPEVTNTHAHTHKGTHTNKVFTQELRQQLKIKNHDFMGRQHGE